MSLFQTAQQTKLLGGAVGVTYKISPAGSSTQIVTPVPINSIVRIVCSANMNVAFGVSSATTATTANAFIPANRPEYFSMGDYTGLAAIGTGDLYLTIMNRVGITLGSPGGPNAF